MNTETEERDGHLINAERFIISPVGVVEMITVVMMMGWDKLEIQRLCPNLSANWKRIDMNQLRLMSSSQAYYLSSYERSVNGREIRFRK